LRPGTDPITARAQGLAPEYSEAAVLIAPGIGAYPPEKEDIAKLAGQPTVAAMPDGLRAVRAPVNWQVAFGVTLMTVGALVIWYWSPTA
jgi:hypothetical protein